MRMDHYLIRYTKMNSKRIKDLNVRHEIIKLQAEYMEIRLLNTSPDNDFLFFLDLRAKAKATNKSKN